MIYFDDCLRSYYTRYFIKKAVILVSGLEIDITNFITDEIIQEALGDVDDGNVVGIADEEVQSLKPLENKNAYRIAVTGTLLDAQLIRHIEGNISLAFMNYYPGKPVYNI